MLGFARVVLAVGDWQAVVLDSQTRESLREPLARAQGSLVQIRASLAQAVAARCPPQLRSHSEDIVQVAMLKVVRVIESRPEGAEALPASYLWRVAYTTTIDELRKMQSRAHTRQEATEAGVAQPGAAPSPERAAADGEVAGAIQDCLGGLSENRRRAVSLYLQGHSVPEAGRALGWARKKTENLVFRGLADLRNCLSGKGVRP